MCASNAHGNAALAGGGPPGRRFVEHRCSDFWQESGFAQLDLKSALGLLETDWAENRAKLPQDIIRSTLGGCSTTSIPPVNVTSSAPAWNATPGGTEIFISHRGMIEVYTNERKDSTVWQPRPADPNWKPNSCAA
jgi:outer membrane protein assembly factor BamC